MQSKHLKGQLGPHVRHLFSIIGQLSRSSVQKTITEIKKFSWRRNAVTQCKIVCLSVCHMLSSLSHVPRIKICRSREFAPLRESLGERFEQQYPLSNPSSAPNARSKTLRKLKLYPGPTIQCRP